MIHYVTNHCIFSFHNKLKNHPRYLDHKPNRRLDDLILILLKFECDTYMAQRTKQVKYMRYTCNIVKRLSLQYKDYEIS